MASSRCKDPILFLTNSEHGQTNVILATAYELLLRNEFDVHIASYPALEPRVEWLKKQAESVRKENHGIPSTRSQAFFHPVKGVSIIENIMKNYDGNWKHKTGIRNAVESYRRFPKIILREDTKNYVDTYDQCLELIKSLNPALVAVDPTFYAGIDACQMTGVEFCQFRPTSFNELCVADQPRGQVFWKYPAISSGYPFPVPWYLIPANIYLVIRFILLILFGPEAKHLNHIRVEHGITTPLAFEAVPGRTQICPSLPEIDFTFEVIPATVVGCGPIVLPATPVSETDPELGKWLTRNPTVLINLGSLHIDDSASALEMARSISTVLNKNPNLQVLWKLNLDWESNTEFEATVRSAIDSDRLRISSWIVAETVSLLTSGSIVAFVHHGGANSYFEACYSGVPQVVLPVWYDTFCFAAKAEFRGIGVYGNKGSEPGVSIDGLTKALLTVLEDEKIKERARAIGQICRKREGRQVACDKLTELARAIKNP